MGWTDNVAVLEKPWEIYAGDDAFLKIQIRKTDAYGSIVDVHRPREIDGYITPENITSYEWRAVWKPSLNSDRRVDLEVLKITCEDGNPGLIVHATANQTAIDGGLIDQDGVFDVSAYVSQYTTHTLVRGRTSYRKDITR